MKASLLLVVVLACSIAAPPGTPARAQACASFPSSDCPAPGVPRGVPSYPCYQGQIKGDWTSMLYHSPSQPSYPEIGSGPGSNTWCFNSQPEAQTLGFQPAP